jgi:hypothetical protein
MSTYKPPDYRKNDVEIRVVEGSDDGRWWRRKLQDDELGTRYQNPVHLAKTRIEIRQISNAERNDGACCRTSRERQLQRVSDDRR